MHQCENCGYIDWSRSPSLQEIYELLWDHEALTSREVAELMEISVQNANNQLRRLESLELAESKHGHHPTGGVEKTYTPIGVKEMWE